MNSGIFLLDKPLGLSSNAALQRVRKLLNAAKAGHVGSLDPLATGMLPICLNEATKVADDILSSRKCYQFEITLGVRTATGDREGGAVETLPVPLLRRSEIERVLAAFLGKRLQIPPMYSALKRDGKPLYELARAGLEVERAPRQIELSTLDLLGSTTTTLTLRTICSKGTYIRVLAEDLARALGTCGHVTSLRRLYVEPFAESGMQTLESLTSRASSGEPVDLIAADVALDYLPAVRLGVNDSSRIRQGQRVVAPPELGASKVRLYDSAGAFFGTGLCDGASSLTPSRLFVDKAA